MPRPETIGAASGIPQRRRRPIIFVRRKSSFVRKNDEALFHQETRVASMSCSVLDTESVGRQGPSSFTQWRGRLRVPSAPHGMASSAVCINMRTVFGKIKHSCREGINECDSCLAVRLRVSATADRNNRHQTPHALRAIYEAAGISVPMISQRRKCAAGNESWFRPC